MLRIFNRFFEIVKRIRNGYDQRVALPLVLVTLFCYSFVLIHPFKAAIGPQTLSSSNWSSNNRSQALQPTLLVDSTQNLPTLSQIAIPKPAPISQQPKNGNHNKWGMQFSKNDNDGNQDLDSNGLSSPNIINEQLSQFRNLNISNY